MFSLDRYTLIVRLNRKVYLNFYVCVPYKCAWQCRLKQGMTFILACTVLQYTHDTFGCLIALLHKIISQLRCRNDLCLCSKTKDNKKKECWRNLNLNVKMLEIYHHHQCLHEIFVIVSYFCSYVKKWSATLSSPFRKIIWLML